MKPPLAFLAKLISPPQLSNPDAGVIRASMPFLRLLGSRSGTIRVQPQPPGGADARGTGTAEQWMKVITRLLPPLVDIRYMTATGTVDLRYNNVPARTGDTASEATRMAAGVERLAAVAMQSAGEFLAMDRESLWATREKLVAALDVSPIDMREARSEERLRELLRAVCA